MRQPQQQRSRHNSGTSMQSKRSDSLDSATTAVNSAAARLLGNISFGELQSHQPRCEEPWHAELRNSFVTLYIQYLQQPGAGFQHIQVLPVTDASSSQRYACISVLHYSLSTVYRISMAVLLTLFILLTFLKCFFCYFDETEVCMLLLLLLSVLMHYY